MSGRIIKFSIEAIIQEYFIKWPLKEVVQVFHEIFFINRSIKGLQMIDIKQIMFYVR
ncbi:hypothetical protein KJS94_11855 [Flavihumibacter rivuli]|uniref:hypothetical protein n=1 Tax=Flavihumibacter rivuli TaxID=2838156 RepID=UPI001BDE6A8F|nr:hypothetical protein [Flavihumibacter rivuli]ULQ55336.1 hypothetical protein KJS94_11855 [Flavihumibacter rivuli]